MPANYYVHSRRRSTAFQNGTAQNKPQQPSSGIDKLLIANTTLAVWLIFLAIGGGILALYYARIGYLPEMEWKSALVYLFIGSVVGGAIGLLLTMSLFIPGFIWSEYIVFDSGLDFSYAPPRRELSGKEPPMVLCLLSTIRYLGLPFFCALLISHVFLIIGKRLYWILAITGLAVMFWLMRKCFKNLMEKKARKDGYQQDESMARRQLINYSSWFTLSVLLNQISMYVIYWLSGSPGELSRNNLTWTSLVGGEFPTFIALTIVCTMAVSITTHAVAALHRHQQRRAVIASLVAAGLLLFTADYFSSLSLKLMNRYGIGDYQRVNLLVTERGGDIVSHLGVTPCEKLQLCNVEILSKVGEQYYLRVGSQAYITLPKSEVVAIRPLN